MKRRVSLRNAALSISLTLAVLGASLPVFANNPCIKDAYTADPTPLWVNNTMYIYCSLDANFATGQTGYNIPNVVLIHSTDLVNWEDDGVIVTSGVSNPWAPDVVYANGTYYLYYTAGGGSIGVLTSTSPYGPFAGGNKSLVTGSTSDPGMGGNLLDPAAFIDTNGQAYLYFGGGGPGSGAGNCSRVIQLNANMISVAGSGSGVPAPNFFEASGINVRNGVYYFSYSSDPAYGMNIEYIMANSPLFTSPTIPAQPIAVANGGAGNCYNNQGGGLVNIGNTWYAAYFNRALATANGLACSEGDYQRSVCFDQMNFNSDGTIQEVTQTTTGPTALQNVNPYATQAAACMADEGGVAPSGLTELGIQTEACSEGGRDVTDIAATDWIEVRNLDFGSCASAFTARVASTAAGGSIAIHLGSKTGTLIGTCTVPATGGTQTWANATCSISGATGLHDIYFVFSGNTFNFESYGFTACGSPTPTSSATATLTRTASPTVASTATRSATSPPTRSATATATPSTIASPTASPSRSATATLTVTRTASPSPTASSTRSAIATVTGTGTLTASPTLKPTGSATDSATASVTPSITPSSSGTPTGTMSATPSGTFTQTASPTASSSQSPPDLPTQTATATGTASCSPTPTAVSSTATASATPSFSAMQVLGGPLLIRTAVPVPNPNPNSLALDLKGPADGVGLAVFTEALVQAREAEIQMPLRAGWNNVPLGSALKNLPLGLYFVRVHVTRAGAASPSVIVKVLITRR
jgi:arabinoxylan arabinofuranohydrolase